MILKDKFADKNMLVLGVDVLFTTKGTEMVMSKIIPTGFIPGFLTNDNDQIIEQNLMKF